MNFLRGSKEEFEKYNPVLEDGQPCFVRDLKTDDNDKETVFYGIKIGDGKNNWIDLPYIGNVNIDLEQVINHINNNDIHVTKEEKDKWNSFLQDISNKLDKDGDASKTYTNFETADERSNIESGDNLSLIFSKISKWFADMKTVSFTGDYNDLENKPEIPDKITYYIRSGITPAMHGVDLFGSDGSETNAPLETYLRDMELKAVSTEDNPDSHTDRGYLQLLTSFDTTLIFNRYDYSHPFTLQLSYSDKDDTSEVKNTVMSVNISGNLHIGSLSEQFISDLYIKSSNDEYKFSVYAYCTFEPSNFADHDYVYYCVWLAVYCDKEVPYKAEGFGSKLVYTNTASNVFYSPADTDHWIDFDKMVQQNIVLTSENKTTYSLSKSGNQIILKGSDGSSSDVTDKDTKYELEQYENVYDSSWSSGPIIILKDSDGNNSEFIVPNTYTIFQFNPIYRVNGGLSINNDEYKTILDLDYFVPSTYNPHYTWRSPIVLDIHAWFYLSKDGTRRDCRIRVYTSLPGDLRIPDMAFIQYLGNYNDVKNIKWTVGVGYSGIASAGLANVIRIGVDNETYSKITNANGNASMQYVTSANGVDLNIARILTNVNNIPIEIIDTFINISRDELSSVATSGNYNDLSNKPTIPDISGKQDKSTAVTHAKNTAVGSAMKPVYVAANGAATPISHSINADVPANAKFTDTTYSDATQSAHGLMSAADKKKLDAMDLSKYLPKSGGVMSGDIDMATNRKDIVVGTHRSSVSELPTAVAGGTVSKKLSLETGLTERRSLIGSWLDENSVWQNILSVRHRNGWNDGPNYGFYLRSLLTSNGSLFWNKQTGANTWQGERVLLDSTNYSTYALPKDGTAKKADQLSSGQMRTAFCYNSNANFSNGYIWSKIGTATLSGGYNTISTTFLGICGWGKHALYTLRVRLKSAGNAVESISFLESGRTGGMLTGLFQAVAINGEKNVTFELWAKMASQYEGTRVIILNEMNLGGANKGNFWTLTSRESADAKTAPTSGDMYVNSSDSSICANAVNATKWSNLVADISTYNTVDTWLLVNKNGVIQHRLEGDLKVLSSTKLSTARKINTVAFDGTKDITIPRSGLSMHSAVGTNGAIGYVAIAVITVKATYANKPGLIRYRNRGRTVVDLTFRFKNVNTLDPELDFARIDFDVNAAKEAYLHKSKTSTWTLYIAKAEAYDMIDILDCQPPSGVEITFDNTHAGSIPEGAIKATPHNRANESSTVAKANTLVDSGWKKMSLGSYASSGEVSYRTYGKQITITGKVVLKTAITSSPRAPQSIATTESLDFFNIKGCSGMGRSNSSTAVYFEAINFSGDNLVDAWSVGDSSISAGSTLYFTITGFID